MSDKINIAIILLYIRYQIGTYCMRVNDVGDPCIQSSLCSLKGDYRNRGHTWEKHHVDLDKLMKNGDYCSGHSELDSHSKIWYAHTPGN